MHNYALSWYLQVFGKWGGDVSVFCSCFLSPMLPIRPCFPSKCPWKGETLELMPESLSLLFGKTRFLTCVTCSTCPSQAGDFLRDFIQLGRVLLSEIFFPSFSVVDMTDSIFFFLLVMGKKTARFCIQADLTETCVSRCLLDIWASLGDWSFH